MVRAGESVPSTQPPESMCPRAHEGSLCQMAAPVPSQQSLQQSRHWIHTQNDVPTGHRRGKFTNAESYKSVQILNDPYCE